MSSVRKTETIPQWKQEEVDELVDFIESFNSVGIVGVAGIPSRQLQAMRRELHGSADVRMSRNTLTVRALEEVNDGVEELTQYVAGQVALIGTNDNPFGLFKQLEASKTPAPINAGEVAPNDVVIPEGDTGVDPGPFVGELQTVGAAARIQDGSIMVTEDSKVLEEGEVVDDDLANVLTELGIEPKEVGLDLKGVYSEGVLFEPDELEIDVDEYEADIRSAAAAARNLSINAEYPTAATVGSLLAKASGEAKSVGLFAEIESPDVVPDLIGKADAQLRSLAAQIDDEEALPEELQGVEAAPAPETDDADEEEQAEEEDDTDDAEATDDDADDDGGDGGDGLGAMFG
ncbi:acidic ribosomal protein P0 [Halorubrum saccharovorum DSM 1137]|mgnify:FL=1|uniref:Large ribosomal subunit protein uL10 n=1 Tax=Halorubrum saccharovorum DSM 1137 TaxID=1227484 RepID=M0E1E3_9EURY|nr:50S ribosomal protein L10 [Halorubrum saccharovorum]ELZ40868.1 acidic ribosomal protein P0 [Halorubrum saccharovorum DSM 1137]